jgi:hypothetical protein
LGGKREEQKWCGYKTTTAGTIAQKMHRKCIENATNRKSRNNRQLYTHMHISKTSQHNTTQQNTNIIVLKYNENRKYCWDDFH